jgi:hypothetical protein
MTILPRQSDNYEELKNRKLIQCELNIKVNTGLQKHSLRQTCIGCKLWRRRTRARRRQCSDRKGDTRPVLPEAVTPDGEPSTGTDGLPATADCI